MPRQTMNTIIRYTERLLGQRDEAAPNWTHDDIEQALDRHALPLEWVLLDNDVDYQHYWSRARKTEPLTNTVYRRGGIDPIYKAQVTVPDFALYTRVGFFEDGYQTRTDRTITSQVHSADSHNIYSGSFIFSTAPNVELFVFATAHNPFKAAADLLEETPDFGRIPLKSRRLLNLSEQFDMPSKIGQYRKMGFNLNRRLKKVHRG